MKFLLAIGALLLPLVAAADTFTGKVVAVSDGDTVKVLRPGNVVEKIRLVGIDAPEKSQDFGQKAKEALTQKIAGQNVTVEFEKRDQYGRLLGKILKGEQDVNLTQIQDGLAWHYKQYAKEQKQGDAGAYAAAEQEARVKKSGLWSVATPTPPWDFRRERKVASRNHPKAKRARHPRRHRGHHLVPVVSW